MLGMISIALLIAGIVVLLLVAWGVQRPNRNLLALGLALWALSVLLGNLGSR